MTYSFLMHGHLLLAKPYPPLSLQMVDPRVDNMLKITNDGRKLALDQRLADEMLPDEAESKVNACADEVYRFWEDGKEEKLTQLVFCDLSTPKNDGTFSVYNALREKLIKRGIPGEEIVFIHEANTEVKKKVLFSKVRRGAVRVLIGSTFKWEPEQMCRTGLSRAMTLTVRGDRVI